MCQTEVIKIQLGPHSIWAPVKLRLGLNRIDGEDSEHSPTSCGMNWRPAPLGFMQVNDQTFKVSRFSRDRYIFYISVWLYLFLYMYIYIYMHIMYMYAISVSQFSLQMRCPQRLVGLFHQSFRHSTVTVSNSLGSAWDSYS